MRMVMIKVLTNMKNCILATDLALFFPNKARLANIVKDNVFDWDQPDHRFINISISYLPSDRAYS